MTFGFMCVVIYCQCQTQEAVSMFLAISDVTSDNVIGILALEDCSMK